MSLAATQSRNAEQLGQLSYNRLMSRNLGPLRVIRVTPHTLTINAKRNHNTMTTDLASSEQNQPQGSRARPLKTAADGLATYLEVTARSQLRPHSKI